MLTAHNLTKKYGKKTALHSVSFALEQGCCLGVAGHNGSGKSTLLSLVAQVAAPTSGELTYNGKNIIGDMPFMRSMVGYIPQNNALLPDITVLETLRFWQKTYGLHSGALLAPSSPAAMLGLDAIAGKKIATLSGGMKKRLSCALALLHEPSILLLDEVLPALDRHYRAVMATCLQQYKQRGACLLYCSHETSELTHFCDSVLVLQEGNTVFYGTTDKFPDDPALLDAWMNPQGNAVV